MLGEKKTFQEMLSFHSTSAANSPPLPILEKS